MKSQELPEPYTKIWHRKARNSEEILVPRFVDPDTGKPLFVHRKGGNIHNGTYYIDQNLEATIAHYSSATFVNPAQLEREYEAAKKLDKKALLAASPLMSDTLIPLPKYYTRMPYRPADDKEIARLIKEAQENKCWITPLNSTSNPYKEYQEGKATYAEDAYSQTMVGDEFDTSPYPAKEKVNGISVKKYIENMMQLIQAIEKR